MSARVAVLGGGPDAERPVSIESSTAVSKALQDAGVDRIVGATRELLPMLLDELAP